MSESARSGMAGISRKGPSSLGGASKAALRNLSRIKIRPLSPIERVKAALPWQGRLSWRWGIRMCATSPVALTIGKLLDYLERNHNPQREMYSWLSVYKREN